MPGERVFIHEGIYRETVVPPQDDQSHAPIVFEGAGGCTIVSGADLLAASWEPDGDGVYRTAAPVSNTTQLFVDGKMMNLARWPDAKVDGLLDAPMAITDSGTGEEKLVDADLPEGDWTGAHVFLLPGAAWVAWTRTVESHDQDANTLVFDSPVTHEVALIHPSANNDYYLFGHRGLLDSPGEWFQDESGVLYLMPPADTDITTARIEVKNREHAFDLTNKSNIELKDLLVFAATVHMEDATGCIADGVHLRYPMHEAEIDGYAAADKGNLISGQNNVFQNGSVSYSSDSGLFVTGTHNTIQNNYIHDVAYRVGGSMGGIATPYDGGAREHVFAGNTIFRTGRFGIGHMDLANGQIVRNHIFDVGLLSSDLGGIYTWDCDGEGTEIAYNLVEDVQSVLGSGIYLDDGTFDHVVHHNMVRNLRYNGIVIKAPNHVQNNTIVDSGDAPVGIIDVKPEHHYDQTPVDITGATIFNNNGAFVKMSVELTVPAETAGRSTEVGYVKTLVGASAWTTASVAYNSLSQISWSYPALTFNAQDVGKIGFRAVGQGNFVLELDNIMLVAADGSTLLIDDFEDGDEQGEQGGWWWAGGGAADESCEDCAASSAELQMKNNDNNGYISVDVVSAADGWNIVVIEQDTVAFENYDTIQFDYRLSGDAVLQGATGTPQQGSNTYCAVNEAGIPIGDCAIDAGEQSTPFWGEFAGASPDVGAFESDSTTWTAGASVDDAIWRHCLSL